MYVCVCASGKLNVCKSGFQFAEELECAEEVATTCGGVIAEADTLVAGVKAMIGKNGNVYLVSQTDLTINPLTILGGVGGGGTHPKSGKTDMVIPYTFHHGDKTLIQLERDDGTVETSTLYSAVRKLESKGNPVVGISWAKVGRPVTLGPGQKDELQVTHTKEYEYQAILVSDPSPFRCLLASQFSVSAAKPALVVDTLT